MKATTRGICGPVLGMACVFAASAHAQADSAAPDLSARDAEAYEMTQSLQFGCNPRWLASIAESESIIEHDPAPLAGKAGFDVQQGNTFLVLMRFNDDGSRHCLVLTRMGGPPEAGRYAVERLSASVSQADPSAAVRPFYGMFGLRNQVAASILVVDSGFVQIDASEPERIEGTFELAGFAIDGAKRTDGVVRRGSFRALKVEK